jgi:hypothetical protein
VEAQGMLSTRVVFDGQILEVFQGARSIARAPVADLRSIRLEEGKKRAEMKVETTWGTLLTPERRPLPLAFSADQVPAAQALVDEVSKALPAQS